MDINNVIKDYAMCVSNNAITAPTGGTWISALALYYGITEPVNGSWIQAYCNYLGITTTVNGSWTIALAASLSITQPKNGSWWYAIADEQCNGVVPSVPFIWDQDTNLWETEIRDWDFAAPQTPLARFTGVPTTTVEGGQVQFTDDSLYTPTSWLWSFTGGTPATSTAQNPLITYNNVGVTEVELEATNSFGSNALVKPNYITTNTASKTLTFEMRATWSLYWYSVAVRVEKESPAGTWTPIEIDGNPFIYSADGSGTQSFYKTDQIGAQTSGINGIRYYQFDPSIPVGQSQQAGPAKREITLDSGFNYRIVSQVNNSVAPNPGSSNYGRFCWYTVMDGATQLLPEYPAAGVSNNDALWDAGTIQQTFTI